jgi:hypothetical protein
MKLPSHEMRDTVTVRPHTGHSALGPVYGTEYSLQARVEPYTAQVTNDKGEEVLVSAEMMCGADCTLRAPDAVAWNGQLYEVIKTAPVREGIHVHHVEVLLSSIVGDA